jgi:hypothetical protein
MATTKRPTTTTLVLFAVTWAIALIACAPFLKGDPPREWIELFIFAGGITVWLGLLQSRQHASLRG